MKKDIACFKIFEADLGFFFFSFFLKYYNLFVLNMRRLNHLKTLIKLIKELILSTLIVITGI